MDRNGYANKANPNYSQLPIEFSQNKKNAVAQKSGKSSNNVVDLNAARKHNKEQNKDKLVKMSIREAVNHADSLDW